MISYVIFALRVAVGGLLVVAGALKIGHAADLAATIAAFRILPAPVIAPLALFLPFFEVGLGGYLIVGLFTRTAALIALTEFVVFATAIASVVMRHIPTSCGCFGPGDTAPATWADVGRDLLLAIAAALIVRFPPGRFAVDTGAAGERGAAPRNGAVSPKTEV